MLTRDYIQIAYTLYQFYCYQVDLGNPQTASRKFLVFNYAENANPLFLAFQTMWTSSEDTLNGVASYSLTTCRIKADR